MPFARSNSSPDAALLWLLATLDLDELAGAELLLLGAELLLLGTELVATLDSAEESAELTVTTLLTAELRLLLGAELLLLGRLLLEGAATLDEVGAALEEDSFLGPATQAVNKSAQTATTGR